MATPTGFFGISFSPDAFKGLDFSNLAGMDYGIKPIDLSTVGPVAPLSNADLLASASRAASSPTLSFSPAPSSVTIKPGPISYTPPTLESITSTYKFDPNEFVGPVAPKTTTKATTPSPLNTITLTPRTEQTDLTPAPLGSFDTLKINQPTVKPTTTFDPGEFVGPVAPGSTKPLPTTDITITPSFIAQTRAEDQVKSAFDKVLGRQPSTGPKSGLEFWTGELLSGRVSPADLEGAIARGAQGGDRLAANQFLGTDYFKVADPTTVPYRSLLEATPTVTNQPSVIQTYNQKAQEREDPEKPTFTSWQDIPNIDETEIQLAQDAGYESPLAYFLAKVDSTDPELSSWRETTRDLIFTDKRLKDLREEYLTPIDRDAETQIYNELRQQYDIAKNDFGYKYKNEGDLDEILRGQAAKLAAGGVKSIYDIGVRRDELPEMINGFYTDPTLEELYPLTETLINKRTGDPIYDVSLGGSWRDDPTAYNFKGPEKVTVESMGSAGYDRIGFNTAVKDMADISFRMVKDPQGNDVPFILPIWKSTKDTSWMMPVAMLASAFAGPYATQIGASLGATTVAGQAALGTAVISSSTQLVINGKIDPGSTLLSVGGAYLGATGNLTGSDIAEYSASLAEQGLGSAQIADDLMSIGVNPVTANLAGNFAAAGVPVEVAPMITAGGQNMALVGLATQSLDADVLTNAFLRGASGEASSLAVDKIIGEENIKIIADATGLTSDQAGSIATSALMNGFNAEVTDTNNFFDAAAQTLIVSGVSTATANKVAMALDDMTSSKGRAALVGGFKNVVEVAGTAGWNGIDVGDALEFMAPNIIGNAISTYVRTPDIPKADDKTKVSEVEGVEVAGIVTRGTMDALKTKALIGETVADTQVDDQGYTQKTLTGVDNNGNPYTYKITYDDKGDVSYSWTDAQGTPQISRQRPEFKSVTPATSADQIDLTNKDDEDATAWYMSDLFFGGAFKDFKAEDIPLVGGLFKTAAKNQGIGLDGLGNQLKDYSTSYSLITGTPFETTMQGIGDGLIAYGKELGSEDYLKEINQFNNDYIKQASEVRPDGLGKSAWDRYTDWWSMARGNPGAAAGSVLYEIGQETLPLAAAATVLLTAPTALGAGAAVTLGVVTSSLLDANEVFGNTGADRYQYGIANGESEDVARTNAIKEAGVNAFATLGTEFLADKSLMNLYTGGLKTSIALGLGATKSIVSNWGQEYVEALAHTYNKAAQRGIPIDDNFHNNARSLAVLEATIGKHTATSIASPAIVSSVAIGVNENGQDVTLEDLRSGNETLASVNLDAPVNVTESGDTLTLGGLTAILQENDVPVDFELDIDTPVFQSSDGSVITYNELEALSSLSDQSFAEVIGELSNNQIQIPKELTNPVDTTVQDGVQNQDLASINLAKSDSVTIDSTKETNPNTGVTVTETVNIRPDSTIDPNPEVDPATNININTVTVTNPNDNSEVTVDVVTDPNNNVPTEVAATEITGDVKIDITPTIRVNVEEPIAQGTPIKEAVVKAVEETKKEPTSPSRSGAGTALTGAGMALPALGSLIEEDDRGLSPLRTTGKREFESPLAAFLRKVSGEPEPEAQPVEKKEPSMDYYSYGKPSEIDEVLGSVSPTGLPTFEFAELGEMGPSFQMRSGGMVPPFAGGGPLTMAAGKLRKDYRKGDAVEGPGDGQSDDIPAMLADGEFVIPADVVAALGNGSNKAGADKLYEMMHNIRRQARKGKPEDLPKPAKSPLQYITRR